MPKARAAAQRAAEIDLSLSEAHVSLGIIKTYFDFDWAGGASEFARAVALNPDNAAAHLWHGWTSLLLSNPQDGIAEARVAHDLDPLSPFIETGLGQMFYLSGNAPAATQILGNVVAADPKFFNARYYLG